MSKKTDLKTSTAHCWDTKTTRYHVNAFKKRYGLAEPAARLFASLQFEEKHK